MLRITVEIWPGGEKLFRRTLAIADIGNISDLADTSDYAIRVKENDNPIAGAQAWSAEGQILQHDRRASVWALVEKVAAWAADKAKVSGHRYLSLQDIGCKWPDCKCDVPDYAWSEHNRRQYCRKHRELKEVDSRD